MFRHPTAAAAAACCCVAVGAGRKGHCAQRQHSAGQVMVWNLDTKDSVISGPVRTINCHQDVILSMSFNTNGSLLATTCKDRKIRIVDPRLGIVLQVCAGPRFQGYFGNGVTDSIVSSWAQPLEAASLAGLSIMGEGVLRYAVSTLQMRKLRPEKGND